MRDDRGFALITVLWSLVLLTLLAGLLIQTTRTSTSLERNAWRRMQVEAAAETGFTRAILSLLEARADKRWPINGREIGIVANGLPLTITIQDEFGRIDLNTAPRELLASLFASTGSSQTTAEAFADAILDWRQNSANRRDSIGAESTRHARQTPFRSVDELKSLPGMTEKLFEQVEPGLTIYSRRPAIDPITAPRQALLALPGATVETVQKALRERGQIDTTSNSATAPLIGRAFHITIAVNQAGVDFRTQRTVRILPQGNPAYWTLSVR